MFRNPLSFLSPSAAPPLAAGDLEAGFSGGPPLHHAKTTNQALTPLKPSRFFFDDLSDDESHHFLDFCFLCKKHLCNNRDIYMYRGDMPFCSVECRQEQIEMDEARERNSKLAMMEKQQQEHKKSANLTKSQRISVRHGTVAPA